MGLAAVDAAQQGIAVKGVHGYTLSRARLEALQRQMSLMTEAERRRMPGMNPRRADIIVAGNAVLIGVLAMLGRDEIVVCSVPHGSRFRFDLLMKGEIDRSLAANHHHAHALAHTGDIGIARGRQRQRRSRPEKLPAIERL